MTQCCPDKRLLIQAHHDGELDAAASAALMAHVAECPGCAALQAELAVLSRRLRAEVVAEPAPETLRRRLTAAAAVGRPANDTRRLARPIASFGVGALLAASLVLVLMPGREAPMDELVAGHVRALQPGHLTDVLSTDQHTVKPWFDGRLDFAPPVKDLAAQGFPLVGGRLDYIGNRAVAALVYRRDRHPIDLFVWPGTEPGPGARVRQGYNVEGWTEGGMVFRAVSDLDAADLAAFGRMWRALP